MHRRQRYATDPQYRKKERERVQQHVQKPAFKEWQKKYNAEYYVKWRKELMQKRKENKDCMRTQVGSNLPAVGGKDRQDVQLASGDMIPDDVEKRNVPKKDSRSPSILHSLRLKSVSAFTRASRIGALRAGGEDDHMKEFGGESGEEDYDHMQDFGGETEDEDNGGGVNNPLRDFGGESEDEIVPKDDLVKPPPLVTSTPVPVVSKRLPVVSKSVPVDSKRLPVVAKRLPIALKPAQVVPKPTTPPLTDPNVLNDIEVEYKCKKCCRRFTNLNEATIHAKTHMNYKCGQCSMLFSEMAMLLTHIERDHNAKYVQMEVPSSSCAPVHQEKTKPLEISKPQTLQILLRSREEMTQKRKQARKEELRKNRLLKKQIILEREKLKRQKEAQHIKRMRQENETQKLLQQSIAEALEDFVDDTAVMMPGEDLPQMTVLYACPTCSMKYPDENSVLEHLATHDALLSNTEMIYSCLYCSLNFPIKFDYEQHLRRHSERNILSSEVLFRCHICLSVFLDEGNYFSHMATHGEPTDGQIVFSDVYTFESTALRRTQEVYEPAAVSNNVPNFVYLDQNSAEGSSFCVVVGDRPGVPGSSMPHLD